MGLLSLCWWQELCRLNKQYSHVHTWLEFIYFCDLTQNHKWWQHCSFRWGVDLLFFFFNTKAIFTNRLTLLNHGKECSLNSADCCSAVFIYQDAVVVTTFYLPPGPVLLSLANRASTASSSVPWVFRASELTAQLKPISWNHTNIQTLKPQMITLLAQHIHTDRWHWCIPKRAFHMNLWEGNQWIRLLFCLISIFAKRLLPWGAASVLVSAPVRLQHLYFPASGPLCKSVRLRSISGRINVRMWN